MDSGELSCIDSSQDTTRGNPAKRNHPDQADKSSLLFIAKISGPRLPEVVHRERLFKLLDRSMGNTAFWIQAPAGAGKTTLVASWLAERKLPSLWYQVDERDTDPASFFYYMGLAAKKAAPRHRKPLPLLTPEYLPGIRIFTKKYFEALYSRLKSPGIIVFDNYQEALAESQLHQVICEGVNVVPPGINIIFISRHAPPSAMVCLKARGQLATIGWDDIRLTVEETAGLVALREENAAEGTARRLHEMTHGWTAGVILLMERMRRPGDILSIPATDDLAEVFDYFAEEIFAKVSPEVRDFLLKSSFLPKMTAVMAERLSGFDGAERLLSHLVKNSYFTQRHEHFYPVYQYHPLFREFLRSQAKKKFPAEEMLRIKRHAAELLAENGEVEAAISLLREAEDWEGVAIWVLSQARGLVAQGRGKTVLEWLEGMPEIIFEKLTYVLFWRGICRSACNPHLALTDFANAFESFRTCGDRVGMCLSWSAAVNAAVFSGNFSFLQTWMQILEELLDKDYESLHDDIKARLTLSMLSAMYCVRPDHPLISITEQRAYETFCNQNLDDVNLRVLMGSFLSCHYMYSGNFSRTVSIVGLLEQLAERGNVSELTQIAVKNTKALTDFFTGSFSSSCKNVLQGIDLAERSGVYTMYTHMICSGISSALCEGDEATVSLLMEKFQQNIEKATAMDMAWYHLCLAWKARLQGDLETSLQYANLCNDLLGTNTMLYGKIFALAGLTQIHHDRGENAAAMGYFTHLRRLTTESRSSLLEFVCLMLEAQISLDRSQEAGISLLGRAMAIGSRYGIVNFLWWLPDVMSRLCLKALEEGIEVDYVRYLIQQRRLHANEPPLHLENWPWPLKIHTMGTFRLVRDGEPVEFSGKVQEKPLALLKAIIALGGKEVPEERLCDLLWPSADGDAAYHTYATNLHRLRKLLGQDQALLVRGGTVTLNPRTVWVDALAFDEFIRDRGPEQNAGKRVEKAMALYGGHFLAADKGAQWAVPMREKLRSRLLVMVSEAAARLEEKAEWEKAAVCYQKGIETDDLMEEYYQRLMVCYYRLDRRGQALALYRRCCHVLAIMGLKPSPATRAIYAEVTATSE